MASESNKESVTKCVVVGDGAIGKTCLLVSYTTGHFPEEYNPTVFDNFNAELGINDKTYKLNLFDTAGQEDFDRLRPLSYPLTDVFLVCFSVVMPVSFRNIKEKWISEIRYYCPSKPYILVGLQSDLRGNRDVVDSLAKEKERPIEALKAEKLAKSIGAVKYMECSAFTMVRFG